MPLLDMIRREIVMYIAPGSVESLPDYYWVLALAAIIIASLILKWKGPEVEDGGIMGQI